MSKENPTTAVMWIGRVITFLIISFLLVDSIMKVVKAAQSVEGTTELGWPEGSVQGIGLILLICTALYMIPRTSLLGAILLTGYLGGAVVTMALHKSSIIFPSVFGILVWVGLWLRDGQIRRLIPWRRS